MYVVANLRESTVMPRARFNALRRRRVTPTPRAGCGDTQTLTPCAGSSARAPTLASEKHTTRPENGQIVRTARYSAFVRKPRALCESGTSLDSGSARFEPFFIPVWTS